MPPSVENRRENPRIFPHAGWGGFKEVVIPSFYGEMADLSPVKRGTPRVMRVLLYGHAGSSQDRFARDIGVCCDALLREDINI
jgi:hypothetical protein